jgi:GNAT superfamily N-acetyltransferase
MHPNQLAVTIDMVRELVAQQFPEWTGLAIRAVDSERTRRLPYARPMIRLARASDAAGLTQAEKRASLAALSHVFPPERYPYPESDVLARWELNLARTDMITRVEDHDEAITGFIATAHEWIEHLGVVPELWGTGLGQALLEYGLADISARGFDHALLWVLDRNERAQRFYVRHGWALTGVTGEAEWPPYPREVQMRCALEDQR